MAVNDDGVISDMHFLEKDELYHWEKPYSLRFPPIGVPQLAQSNVKREKHRIQFHNMRGMPDLRIDTCGFELLRSPCTLAYDDFEYQQKIQDLYLTHLASDLQRALKAKLVVPMDFSVRSHGILKIAPH